MANEAHKEPTMEEILASIRKIISDDDVAAPAAEEEVETVVAEAPVAEEEPFEPLQDASAGDDLDEDMFGEDEDTLEAELDTFEAEAEEELDEPPSFEDMLGAARAVVDAPEPAETEVEAEELVAELEEEFVTEIEPETVAEQPVAASQEEDMQASARYQDTTLTDENTADVAASTLGKLIARMDMSGDNTIEGLIRELLKPMMKEWLDANLPKIVEEKVEAEVQRIARMAR